MLDLGGKPFDPQLLSEAMTGAVTNTFIEMCSVKFTQPPSLKKAPVSVTKEGKIKAYGHEKLNAASFISIIAFALSPKHYEKNKISGFLTVYIKESCVLKLFQSIGFPVLDDGSGFPTVEVGGEFYDSAEAYTPTNVPLLS